MTHNLPMSTHSSKRPKDANQLAKYIVDMSVGDLPKEEPPKEREKNPAAVALARLGAAKGGRARAAKLSDEARSEIAKRAAEARWKKAS
jgi:hypothetical protein